MSGDEGKNLSIERLSPRTRVVLGALNRGLAEKEIATLLTMSRHTVHTYVKRLYRTFSVNRRSELVAFVSEQCDPSQVAALDAEIDRTMNALRTADPTGLGASRAKLTRDVHLRLPTNLVERVRREHGDVEKYLGTLVRDLLSKSSPDQ